MNLAQIIDLTPDQIRAENLDAATLTRLRGEATQAARGILDRSNGGNLLGADAQKFDRYTSTAQTLTDLKHDADLEYIRAAARPGGQTTEGAGGEGTERTLSITGGELTILESGGGTAGAVAPQQPRSTNSDRDQAMRSLDAAVSQRRLSGRGAEVVERAMNTAGAGQSWTQRWAIAAGAPAYESAFSKVITGERGHLLWTSEEQAAYRAVEQLQAERAMSLSGTSAGSMVPLTLDPAVMLASGGSTNPLRQIARVVQTASDAWQGVSSDGVTAEWKSEAAEMADASPTMGSPKIPVHLGDAFVPWSFEAEMDAVNLAAELGKLLADAAEQLTAEAFTTGSGTGQPKGIVTALAAAAGSKIAPATAETVTAADVYALQSALPPRFQPNAKWTASLEVINHLRQMETTNGALKFTGLQDAPASLLGRAMHENSNQGGLPDGTVTAANLPIIYGDFAAGMVIADRIGSTVEHIPNLFGANGRPTGQRGLMLWFRTGSDVVIPNAFRALSVPTTA